MRFGLLRQCQAGNPICRGEDMITGLFEIAFDDAANLGVILDY
jgi:hypothetical protein